MRKFVIGMKSVEKKDVTKNTKSSYLEASKLQCSGLHKQI